MSIIVSNRYSYRPRTADADRLGEQILPAAPRSGDGTVQGDRFYREWLITQIQRLFHVLWDSSQRINRNE
jgi:hypothetical protein